MTSEKIAGMICDTICKYPDKCGSQEQLDEICETCPVNELADHNGDIISRADAISVLIRWLSGEGGDIVEQIESLPSAVCDDCIWTVCNYNKVDWDTPSAEAQSDDLIIKGAKGIKDGLYNIKDGKLFKYYAKGGIVQAYEIVSSAEPVQGEWIPCSERLPENGHYYLWCSDMGHIQSDYYWNGFENGMKYGYNIVAWMPLPNPYKGGEDE